MLIIWGWRVRGRAIGEGTFHCPEEGGDRRYRLMEARRWFTLFWIPIVGGKVLGEYVECCSCEEPFERKALDVPTSAQIRETLRTALRHVIVAIIRSDEKVTNAERHVALAVMAEFGHEDYLLVDLERDVATLEVGELDDTVAAAGATLSAAGQERVVRACVELAAADGAVSDEDLELIATVGRSIGMSPAHIKGVIDEVESRPRRA